VIDMKLAERHESVMRELAETFTDLAVASVFLVRSRRSSQCSPICVRKEGRRKE